MHTPHRTTLNRITFSHFRANHLNEQHQRKHKTKNGLGIRLKAAIAINLQDSF